MKPEDFDAEMRAADPAADLGKLNAEAKADLLDHATVEAPLNELASRRRRRGVTAGVAAALVIGITASMNGAMTASDAPQRLVFGQSASGVNGLAAESDRSSLDQKMSGLSYWGGGWNAIFESAGNLNGGGSATGYKIVLRDDYKQIVNAVAADFGLGKPEWTTQDGWTSASVVDDSTGQSMSANLQESSGDFGYYNQLLNPWYQCEAVWTENDKGEAVTDGCEPEVPTNLPSDSKATALFLSALESWGIETEGLTVDVMGNDEGNPYSVYATAQLFQDGFASPISYSMEFGENGEIMAAWGSLSELEAIGEFDLISGEEAVDRANAQNEYQRAAYEKMMEENGDMVAEVQPEVASDVAVASEDSAVAGSDWQASDPSEPVAIDEPVASDEPVAISEPMPAVDSVTYVVTSVKQAMNVYYLADGQMVWLPTFTLVGYDKAGSAKDSFEVNSVIAIVESQIDIESLWNGWYGGPMALAAR